MKKTALPAYASILGDTHFPPVDNQGGIGSCASQAVMRNQFTNAVSRLLHEKDPTSDFCPRDRFGDVFTPKYSYNLVGPGTAWVYEFIEEHGALFQTEGIFEKAKTNDGFLGGSIPRDKDGVRCPASVSFLTGDGQMEKALMYRLSHFDQIWVVKPPYNERLTTCPEGRALLDRIKEAIVGGEAVVTGGYPGRWVYTTVTGCGNLASEGEKICVAAAGNGGGGHQVTIVGYDDGVTTKFAGVTLTGAFLIMNSYGPGWMNKGLCWMSYDAVNTASEYPALNDPKLYSGPMYLTPKADFSMFPPSLTTENQTLEFRFRSNVLIHGKEYPAYTLFDGTSGKYVGYGRNGEDRALIFTEEDRECRFALVPYEDVLCFPGADRKYEKTEYAGSYWLYAVDKEGFPDGFSVLDAGVSYASSGRKCALATHNGARYPEAKSWLIDAPVRGDRFASRLAIAAGAGTSVNRIWTLDQFCFIDRHADVKIGMPPYYVRVKVLATDRDCFKILVTRKSKAGTRTKKHLPAMFRYLSCRPFYGERRKGDYLTFSGALRGSAETAELAFSLEPLLDLPKGASFDDFEWGLELKKGRSGKAAILEAALLDSEKRVLYSAQGPVSSLIFR